MPSAVDRRSYALVLSADGETLLADLKVRVQAHDDKATNSLDAEEKATLMALLHRLVDAA